MKSLRLTLVVSGFLLFALANAYSQPPVVDESDEYSLAMNLQESPNVNSISKSAETDDDMWQNEQPADEKPLVQAQAKANEDVDIDSDNLAEQVHNLQAEIQELRGQIEVQAHDLKMLQQQQLAFYKDLDIRLQKNKEDPSHELSSSGIGSSTIKTTLSEKKRENPADEQISYLAAYELIKSKQFDQALQSMQKFIERYPDSGYRANAHYWVGELYLVKNDNEQALEAFNTVLTKYPKSSKAAASELKASYALANLGQNEAARSKLRHLINQFPDTKTAQLAKQKLETMN